MPTPRKADTYRGARRNQAREKRACTILFTEDRQERLARHQRGSVSAWTAPAPKAHDGAKKAKARAA